MKDRFNILDTYAIIKELQHFNSYRVNNIYDIDNKRDVFELLKEAESMIGKYYAQEAKQQSRSLKKG